MNKFVKDVMQGYMWGMYKEERPLGDKDFTNELNKLELIATGNEVWVYTSPEYPGYVLKIAFSRLGRVSLDDMYERAKKYLHSHNSLPYNLPTFLEGYVIKDEKYYPVYSQRKVTIPTDVTEEIFEFGKSVNGKYFYNDSSELNNILRENDIKRARDFKLRNIGVLSDGTVMGIDLR